MPSFRGNLLRSGNVAPLQAPACPKAKWVYLTSLQANRSDDLFPPSLTSWGDGCAFLTRGARLVRLSLLGGATEVWSHQLPSTAHLQLCIPPSELSAEIRVEPSRDDFNASHLDFLRAKSVIALCASTHVYSFNWETGTKEWEVNLQTQFSARAVGGMSVLPHCVILTIRENEAPRTLFSLISRPVRKTHFSVFASDELFAIALDTFARDDSTSTPKVLWKTSLLLPSEFTFSYPAVDMFRGHFVCGLESKTPSSLPAHFFALSVIDGRVISKNNSPRFTDDQRVAGVFSVSLTGGCAIVPSFDEGGDGIARVGKLNLTTGNLNRVFGLTIGDDQSRDSNEEEEAEEESIEDQSDEPDVEFIFDHCVDSTRNLLMFAAGCSGGGGGYETYLYCVDLEKKRRIWITTDDSYGKTGPFSSIPAGRTNVDQPTTYSLAYGSPLCESTGASLWPAMSGVDIVYFGALQ